jgi:hypothetical protein
MSEPSRSESRGNEVDAAQPRGSRWWVRVLTFGGGVVAGILVVGLLGWGTPDFGSGAGSNGAGGPGGRQDPTPSSPVPATARALVNSACLRVINEAQDVYSILSQVDEAVTDVDLQVLDDLVRRLQPVESRLERDLAECDVDTEVTGGGSPTPEPSPASPVPSPSTT